MKKKLLYCLTALLAIGATSCKDDDEIMGAVNPSTDFNRMPMTQFRQLETTNKDENADPYCSRVITEEINTIELQWYGIEGAGGYEIKFGPNADLASKPENWDKESILTGHYFVGPDVCSMRLPDLSYDVTYLFAIRVLHPEDVRVDASTGEITGVVENDRHSKWYGLGSQREWARFLRLTTGSRYAFPRAINVGNISADRDAFTVYIDASVKTAVESYKTWNFASEQEMFEDLREHFDFIEDGTENDWQTATFKFDRLQIESTTGTIDPQFKDMPIDMTELVTMENGQPVIGKGEIRVTGLSMNSIYVINLVNTTRDVAYVDQLANTVRKPVWGDPEEPILIRHQSPATDSLPGQVEFDAMCIDNILSSFTDENNTDLPEGTTFYLQGDKAYVVSQNITVPKGFILETDPDDVANGKRAKLYMGGIGAPLNEDGSLGTGIGTSNFMFGRRAVGAPAPLEVGDLVFRNLDIDAPLATNYGTAVSNGAGNYFINMFSDGEEVSFKKIEIDNCYFRRMIRGFIRVQGNKPKIFEQMIVSNCIFSDCGFYDQNGRGYAWFAGDGKQGTSNIFTDFRFINNTIYDSPRTAFVTDNDASGVSYANGGWHIAIENNTFINFSTMTTGRNFFQTRYIPSGSHYSFKRNLIVLAADENDKRNLNQYGADIRECDGEFSFDISDNYSVGCRDAHMKDDGIFNSSQSFMRTGNSFGTVDRWVPGLVDESGAATDDKNRMVVKVLTDDNGNMMKATDLFNNPNPPYLSDPADPKATDHAGPADIYTALRYKTLPSIITEKNIGDPRWR